MVMEGGGGVVAETSRFQYFHSIELRKIAEFSYYSPEVGDLNPVIINRKVSTFLPLSPSSRNSLSALTNYPEWALPLLNTSFNIYSNKYTNDSILCS